MSVKRYDFDCYAFYDSARLNVQECDDGDYVLHSDYAALLARHNALVEAVARMFAAHETWAQKASASYLDWAEGRKNYDAARAEVDRLLTEEKP